MSQQFQKTWFIVPNHIMNLPDLTMAQLRIYETIYEFWNNGKPCFLSNQKIMERTGIKSESTIREAFAFFERHGELARRTDGKTRYLVQPERKVIHKQDDDPVDTPTPTRRQTDALPVDAATHNNNKFNTNKLNKSVYEKKPIKQSSGFSDVTVQSTTYNPHNKGRADAPNPMVESYMQQIGILKYEKIRY